MGLEGGFSSFKGGLRRGSPNSRRGLEKGRPFSSHLEKGGHLRGASRGLDKRELEKEA